MKTFLTFVGTIVALIIGFLIYIYSGFYNIGANVPHNSVTRWIISKTVDNSVKYHAELINEQNIQDTSLINLGFREYTHSCIGCHGAPGIKRPQKAPHMYPNPPELVKAAVDWKPSELFWITKNGIKMTGMPEFGSVKSNRQIWGIVAFVKKMTTMTPEQFNAFKAEQEKNSVSNKKKRHLRYHNK
jgi:mono/diheme cytochrome c family protein